MLTIADVKPNGTRREFLRVGTLGFAGLSLPGLLASQAQAAGESFVRDKAVVLLFLQGGPSHIEMFDPKMTAPVEIRSQFGEVETVHPGVTFGGHFPQLAAMADRFSIVRSYGSRNSGHSYMEVVSGGNPLKAAMSSIYARLAGSNHPQTGLPNNVLVLPEAVDANLKLGSNFETGALPTLTAAGQLGATYAAFNPSGGGQLKSDMELRLKRDRFDDRKLLLGQLDRLRRQMDGTASVSELDQYQQRAMDVILGGASQAFDISQEDPKTVARYDTSHLFTNEEIQRWYDMKRGSNLLGKQMLLARRLVEAGCGFVTVSDCGWDMHSNSNSPKNLGGMKWLGPQVDHAVAAFLQDLEERGLSQKVLLVVTGEMGRTPRINRDGGRDHYGELTPLLVAGGGLKMGQVIGESDRQAARPATQPFGPDHLLATIMHTVFDAGVMRLNQTVPREVVRLMEQSQPIGPLMA